MRKDNKYNHAGPSAEDRALEKFAEMMIEKISTLQSDWKNLTSSIFQIKKIDD